MEGINLLYNYCAIPYGNIRENCIWNMRRYYISKIIAIECVTLNKVWRSKLECICEMLEYMVEAG